MSHAEREHVGHALGQLVGRLDAGQSLQFYVEATPGPAAGAARAQPRRGRARPAARCAMRNGRADALRRLHDALCESLERHAQAQAAVDVAYYVIVPYVPDQRVRVDWRELRPRPPLAAGRGGARALARVAPAGGAESLHVTDAVRGDLEALDLVHAHALGA